MTSQQILQSDMLDILFEKRNKLYGAYWLRRHYDNHLMKAIGGTSLLVLGLLLFVRPSASKSSDIPSTKKYDLHPTVLAPLKKIEPIIPKVPQQATAPMRQENFNNQIRITDNPKDPVAKQIDLENAAIGGGVIKGPIGPQINPPSLPSSGGIVPADPEPPKNEVVSRQPQFPGGTAAWLKFLERYLQAPQELEPGERRMVSVRFSVDEEGTVTAFQVVQSGGSTFDNEVIRVLKKMPKWLPALQSGKPIAVSFTQPVTFAAQEE